MKHKIILLIDSRIALSNGYLTELRKTIDIIEFQKCEELPQQFDNSLYSGVIFKSPRIGEDSLRYIEKIHSNLVEQPLYVVAEVSDKKIYSKILELENLSLHEVSSFEEEQINGLLPRVLRDAAQKKDTGFYRRRFNSLINSSPFNVITLNVYGKILDANRSFLQAFNYSAPFIIDTHLSSYLPSYSFDEIAKFAEQASVGQSYSLQTTFLDHSGKLVPVAIFIYRSGHGKEDLHMIINDKSEVLAYKRELDYQGRAFEYFNQLIEKLFLNTHSHKEILDSDLLKKIYNSDQVLECPVLRDVENNRTYFDKSLFSHTEEKLFNIFEKIIATSMAGSDVSVLHFSDKNPSHSEFLGHAQTLIVVPVYYDGALKEIIAFFYANHYEPDKVISKLFDVLIQLLRFKQILNVQSSGMQPAEHHKEILDNALDGIYRSTLDGQLVFANPAFIKMLDYDSFNEIKNVDIAKMLYDESEDRLRFLEQVRQQPQVQNYVTRLRSKKGRIITVLEHARLVKQASGKTIIEGVIRDITSSELIKEQLRQSRQFADELIDEAGVIIVAERTDNKECIIWNKKAQSVLGYGAGEILGKNNHHALLYPDEKYRNYVEQEIAENIYGTSHSPVEFNVNTSSGKRRVISWTYITVNTEQYDNVIVSFGNDITDMRFLEKRFIETQRMDFFSTLTTVLADQFRGLVSAMAKDLDYVRKDKSLSTVSVEAVDRIELKLREANRLLEKMRSHADASEAHPDAMVEPNQIIEQAVVLLEKTIPDNINVTTRALSSRYVKISEAHFNQILFNLALNAVNALDQGGEILIETRQVKPVEDEFLANNNAIDDEYVKVVFSDNGRGMDEDTRQRLFEPFFSTTSAEKNKGLGATLVYNIVRKYNGYIDVESRLGSGTSVILYLPVIEKTTTGSGKSKRHSLDGNILVVDDSKEIREILKDIAQNDGYNTFLAKDGLEGLELFKRNLDKIDLVILDIIMPNLDGRELFYKIRDINPQVKILVTSGYSKPEVKKELLAAGVDGFLPKPFNVKSVRERLIELMQTEQDKE